MHKLAVVLERERIGAQTHGGIQQAMDRAISLGREVVVGAMRSMYFLAKQEIPHTTNYSEMLKVMILNGCKYLKHLEQGANAKYTSE